MTKVLVHVVQLTLALLLGACAGPTHLTYRSPMLDVPTDPLAPEGRPAAVPTPSDRDEAAADSPTPPNSTASTNSPADTDRPSSNTSDSKAALGPRSSLDGEAVVATARELLGRRSIVLNGRRYRSDCTGLVQAVFAKHGVSIAGDVTNMYQYVKSHGTLHRNQPAPGDLVFFVNSYDRNRDGRVNDGLTHVGIVENVQSDGTVSVIHHVARGVARYYMNVARANERQDEKGRVINDWLRPGRRPRLTGELFVGYGTIAPSP